MIGIFEASLLFRLIFLLYLQFIIMFDNLLITDNNFLSTKDYTYELPPNRIAAHPAAKRESSRLLAAKANEREISHHIFSELPVLLPENTLLITNNTKVIPARIQAQKPTGGTVEIFLLEPAGDASVFDELRQCSTGRWRCLLGGRKMHAGMQLKGKSEQLSFTAVICNAYNCEAIIEFQWQPSELTFGELLSKLGTMPLPPYIKRSADVSDIERYQTVYARELGSVAAPTAGLHFTSDILDKLEKNGISRAELTLNVGLGTFKPITVDKVNDIEMHSEKIQITITELRRITNHFEKKMPVVCIGTTSLRTLESLYWFGVELLENRIGEDCDRIIVDQWMPYTSKKTYQPAFEALRAVIQWAEERNMDIINGTTSLLIAPKYHFGTANGLITNFHQPGSTLLLLAAAFLGSDFWRSVYNEALQYDYRFLSYGDACLFWR